MQTEPIITFRNLDHSPVINGLVARRIEVLERIEGRIIGCEVTLEAGQTGKRKGNVVRAHLNIHLPGPNLSIEREVSQGGTDDDLVLAVNKVFSAAETQLKKHKKTMAAVEVKHHPPVLHGEVTLLETELGYGYMRADDGREVYFQRDALTSDDWARVAKGTRLRFREMTGEKGPYATAVTLVD